MKAINWIKSFCGESCFLGESDAPNKAVNEATEKADEWLTEIAETWDHVDVISTLTQYFNVGDYAMYVITMTVKCEDKE